MLKTFDIIRGASKKYWGLLFLGFFVILILELLSLYGPQLIKKGIDTIASGKAGEELLSIIIMILLLALGVTVLRSLGRPMIMFFGWLVDREIRDVFYGHVLMLPRRVSGIKKPGDLMSMATYDIKNIRLASGYGFQSWVSSLLTCLIALGYMFWMSPLLSLMALLPMAFIPILTTRQSRKLHRCHGKIQTSFGNLAEEARLSIGAIRLVKVFNLEKTRQEVFTEKSQQHFKDNMELARISALYLPVVALFVNISQAVVWGAGGAMAVLGSVTPGEIVAFSAYLVMLRTPLVYFGYLVNLFQRANSSRERVDSVLEETPEKLESFSQTSVLDPLEADMEIRNLTFYYPGESTPALVDVNMLFPAGSNSAIVGPVGSGKSTLLKIISRIYEPPPGTVFLGGVDITQIPLSELRSYIGTADQNPFIFSDSIRENLLLGMPGANESQLWEALEITGLANEVRSMPRGLDTPLGERGLRISGGQKGRLSLARLLLQNRPFIQLDDTLSSVDTRAEYCIMDNLGSQRNSRSNIIVSHRPLSLACCNNIFVLNEGRVEAHGSHDFLSKTNSVYQRLIVEQRHNERQRESHD